MKGFVRTPDKVVDAMVTRLFRGSPPKSDSTVLDPGCGDGAMIEGVIRWCRRHHRPLPAVLGIELDPWLVQAARTKFRSLPAVEIKSEDFLEPRNSQFDFVVGNPPYVPITGLTEGEKARYRGLYPTASGRFDLYLLFFDQALRCLKPGGRLVFITPEKFLYVETAAPLRRILATKKVEEVKLVEEDLFGDLVTYPTITTLVNEPKSVKTRVILRDRRLIRVTFPTDGSSWLPRMNGAGHRGDSPRLLDASLRVSCGVATGADAIFVKRTEELDPELRRFAHPTIAGRELTPEVKQLTTVWSMLVPYSSDGRLLAEDRLGALGRYLGQPDVRARLKSRTCARRKPWYAFHETPPLRDLIRPKILCKDITVDAQFWVDHEGSIVPRHSVYYIVPKDPSRLDQLAAYLNSDAAKSWLRANCERAANGFLRTQSHVLKQLPIPVEFLTAEAPRTGEVPNAAALKSKPVEAIG